MTLVRWTPFLELDAIERRMRRMLDEFGFTSAPLPPVDVSEIDGEFLYELEVPGFEEKELSIEVSDHVLTIRGERAEAKEEKQKTYRLKERLATSFERRFELPLEVDTTKIAADFKKGVLFVHVPKSKTAVPHKVAIASK